jgi:hypothetical protein
MKKFIAILMLAFSAFAFAEASFDEIQGLINSKQYAAAAAGLEGIIQNHPKSAKAFYAMAEAQAGLGNLEKAQKALNLAKGIDPTLKFVSEGSVRSLEQAITPQTAKITYEEPSHFWRNFMYVVMFALFGWALYFFWCVYNRKKDEDEGTGPFASSPKTPVSPITPSSSAKKETVVKDYASSYTPRPAYRGPVQSTSTPAPSTPAPAPAPTHTTVVNNSSNDMLTGVLIGNMISNSGHHHETTRVVEREVIRETPSRSSSWDDTPSSSSSSSRSSRSSSWDDDSSSSKSSSWDDSSSRKSSSWDSDSSSSSSSWDSGSSSSDSSSSSSWD